MKAIIIDDEERARKAITSIIDRHCPEVSVVGQGDGVQTGLKAIDETRPELVLLDIQMPDGSGFDLLEKCREIDFHVIFITAYEEYAIKAFDYSALHYLLKPLDPGQFVKAIQKVSNLHQIQSLRQELKAAAAYLQDPDHKIILKTAENVHLISVSEILRCEADVNYTIFHFLDGRQLIVSKTLKEFEGMLSEHGFFRSHKAHLINTDYIRKIEKKRKGFVILKNNIKVPLAIRKREVLIKMIEKSTI